MVRLGEAWLYLGAAMLTVVTNDLGPTATYAARSFVYVGAADGEIVHPDTGEVWPGLGLLTIKVQKSARAGAVCEIDSYVLQAGEAAPEGWPVYLLLNISDKSQRDPYRVTLGPTPACTCKAGQCKAASDKHIDALLALRAEGVLPGPLTEEPAWAAAGGTTNTDWLEAA